MPQFCFTIVKLFKMNKFLSLLKSKKFWTLVAAIVAALTAFFTASCQYSGTLFRTGVHNDTVRYEYRVRSRNAVVSCNQLTSTPEFFRFTRSSTDFITFATSRPAQTVSLHGRSKTLTPVIPFMFRSACGLSTISNYPTFTVSNPSCLANPFSESNVLCESSGIICLASLLPISFVKRSRRGGRRGKGRPKPSTKTISIGGSHL